MHDDECGTVSAVTAKYGFTFEWKRLVPGDYVGELRPRSPGLMQRKRPGEPFAMTRYLDPEPMRAASKTQLLRRAKDRILELDPSGIIGPDEFDEEGD